MFNIYIIEIPEEEGREQIHEILMTKNVFKINDRNNISKPGILEKIMQYKY